MNDGRYGQIPQGTNPFGTAHPILILGIFVFIIPFFNYVMKWGIPGWVSGIGVGLILLGSFLTIVDG